MEVGDGGEEKTGVEGCDRPPSMSPRVVGALWHEGSKLLGVVPLPMFVMQLHCQMACHADGKGYDLTVRVFASESLQCLRVSTVARHIGRSACSCVGYAWSATVARCVK
eukprot:COSAG01_NODE_2537_length_7450_cov_5.509411_2_plen_109_part_00